MCLVREYLGAIGGANASAHRAVAAPSRLSRPGGRDRRGSGVAGAVAVRVWTVRYRAQRSCTRRARGGAGRCRAEEQSGSAAGHLTARPRPDRSRQLALLGRSPGARPLRRDQPRRTRPCASAPFVGLGRSDPRSRQHAVRGQGHAAVAARAPTRRVRDGRQHGRAGDAPAGGARHRHLLAGAASFDAPTDLARRYRDFPRIPGGRTSGVVATRSRRHAGQPPRRLREAQPDRTRPRHRVRRRAVAALLERGRRGGARPGAPLRSPPSPHPGGSIATRRSRRSAAPGHIPAACRSCCRARCAVSGCCLPRSSVRPGQFSTWRVC